MTRRIAVVTGSRAEYGLLVPLLRLLKQSDGVDTRLIVCAAHLAQEFGTTRDAILADGFAIDADVAMLAPGDTPAATAKSVGLGCIGFADTLEKLAPDLMVVLGDRFEVLAAVQTALLLRIPVAHLHGGESTEGAVDDAMRHAITKMSHLHFAAADTFARRIVQMGEHPDRVFNVGALGLDPIRTLQPQTRRDLEDEFQIPTDRPIVLVTLHSETLSSLTPTEQVRPLLQVLGRLRDYSIVITYPNVDFGGKEIIGEIETFARTHDDVVARSHLGQHRYLSVLKAARAVVGNSSSGIIEAPSLGVPTVNIGERQRGRPRAVSIIDCDRDEASIEDALTCALSEPFQFVARHCENPYGDGRTAARIAEVLCTHPLEGLLHKAFYVPPMLRSGFAADGFSGHDAAIRS